MKFSQLFNRGNGRGNGDKNQEEAVKQNPESENQEEEITGNTKIKVIAALLVVGFATYVAWWVQEPSDIRADVLAPTQDTAQPASTEMAMADSTAETSAHETAVTIQDFAFSPSQINVGAGDMVTWTNKDSVPHTVTGDNFSSGTLNSGESYSYTFNDAGTFDYKCSFHPQMTGTITVGAAAASGTSSETSQGVSTELLAPAVTSTALEFNTSSTDFGTTEPALEPLTQEAVAPAANGSVITFPGDTASVTINTADLLAEGDHAAASEQKSLAKSGPEDILYVGLFAAILYFNRRKLASALR